MFPSAADLNHFKHFFLRFLKGVVVEERGFVFLAGKKKEEKKKEGKKGSTYTLHNYTLPSTFGICAGGRFLSLLLLLSTAATPRENKNKHNDDNNGLGEISIHPVRSFPPLPPPLFKLSRKKSSWWTKNLQCIFVVPSPKMQS